MLVNLHSHLEGRVRPATAAELSAELGLADPPEGWEGRLALDGPADLTVYLRKVAATYPFFRSPAAAERIAREAVEDAAASGHDYLELRFGPATHSDGPVGMREVIAAVVGGMAQGSTSTGIPVGAVVAALRHHDAETNLEVARSAAAFAGRGVVGFDLAGDELIFPRLDVHEPAFALARAAGLGITCHAAEAGSAVAVRVAAERLGATRIGHGAHLIDDPAVLRWAADAGIVVEVCPTSNWYTGAIADLGQHPASEFRDAGVRVVLGDDNPMQTGSDLAGERHVLVERLGWSARQLRALDEASIDAAFVEPGVRAGLRAGLSRPTGAR